MFKIVEFSHLIIREYFNSTKKDFINCLDATCGMGNDTIFISKLVGNKGHVDAYDIQTQAINATSQKINQESLTNVTLFHDSHENIDPTQYDLAIFNLGYLPNYDKTITTKTSSTMTAITKLVDEIKNNPDLLIIVCIYPGHEEGKRESNAIEEYVLNLCSKEYLVTKFLNYNRPTSPYIITISRTKM